MDIKLAKTIITDFLPHIKETIGEYVDYRINVLYQRLEHAPDISEVNKLQGAIAELKTFKNIREVAKDVEANFLNRTGE